MKKYIFFFLISLIVYVIHGLLTKHAVYGDGNGYYIIAHTFFFKRSFDFNPIYEYLSQFKGKSYEFSRIFWDSTNTVTGVRNTPWLVGTSIFWLMGLLGAFCVNSFLFLNLPNTHILYELGCGSTGIILMVAGLYFLEKVIAKYVNNEIAEKSIYCLFFGTLLLYYSAFEPALSHQPVFFLISLSLYISILNISQKAKLGSLGLIAGLIGITRIADIIFIIPSVLEVYFKKSQTKKNKNDYLKNICIFLIFFIVALLPQVYFQYVVYGNILINPYLSGHKGPFSYPTLRMIYVHLFAAGGGIFLWSPLFLVGVVGLLVWYRKTKKKKILAYLIVLLLYTILIASWNPIAPSGFGNRFFLSAAPFIAIGIGYILQHKKQVYVGFCIVSILWNILLISQFYLDKPRMVERQGLTIINLILGQIYVPIKTLLQ